MKNLQKLTLGICLAFLVSSCAFVAAPVMGGLYTDVKGPHMATSNPVASKVGTGQASSILGIVATGDASIQSAARSAGITRISHIDYQSKNILGIYATYTVYVYGE